MTIGEFKSFISQLKVFGGSGLIVRKLTYLRKAWPEFAERSGIQNELGEMQLADLPEVKGQHITQTQAAWLIYIFASTNDLSDVNRAIVRGRDFRHEGEPLFVGLLNAISNPDALSQVEISNTNGFTTINSRDGVEKKYAGTASVNVVIDGISESFNIYNSDSNARSRLLTDNKIVLKPQFFRELNEMLND